MIRWTVALVLILATAAVPSASGQSLRADASRYQNETRMLGEAVLNHHQQQEREGHDASVALATNVSGIPSYHQAKHRRATKRGSSINAITMDGAVTSYTTGSFCWKHSYGRGVGKPLHHCPKGKQKIHLLCYEPCPAGKSRWGYDCHEDCPHGWDSVALSCWRWNPLPQVFFKQVEIGKPSPMECSGNEDQDGALCYPKCDDGYIGNGPVCWGNAPKECVLNVTTGKPECRNWIDCGMGAASDQETCNLNLQNQFIEPLVAGAQVSALVFTMGASASTNAAGASGKIAKFKKMAKEALEQVGDLPAKGTSWKGRIRHNLKQDKGDLSVWITQMGSLVKEGVSGGWIDEYYRIRLFATLASILDPTGLTGVVSAYTFGNCKDTQKKLDQARTPAEQVLKTYHPQGDLVAIRTHTNKYLSSAREVICTRGHYKGCPAPDESYCASKAKYERLPRGKRCALGDTKEFDSKYFSHKTYEVGQRPYRGSREEWWMQRDENNFYSFEANGRLHAKMGAPLRLSVERFDGRSHKYVSLSPHQRHDWEKFEKINYPGRLIPMNGGEGAVNNWTAAVALCESKGLDLATYEDICGRNGKVTFGVKDGRDEWIPYMDFTQSANAWVQVGNKYHRECRKLSEFHPNPWWGLDNAKQPYESNFVYCTDQCSFFLKGVDKGYLGAYPDDSDTPDALGLGPASESRPVDQLPYERFHLETPKCQQRDVKSAAAVSIRTFHNTYLSAASGTVEQAEYADENEEWTMLQYKDGKYSLQANNGMFLSVQDDKTMALVKYNGEKERFTKHDYVGEQKLYGPADGTANVKNWNEAVIFCKEKNMRVASFQDICENGVVTFGVRNGEDQWMPYGDEENAWVQVGNKYHRECRKLSEIHKNPWWGLDSAKQSYESNYIFCAPDRNPFRFWLQTSFNTYLLSRGDGDMPVLGDGPGKYDWEEHYLEPPKKNPVYYIMSNHEPSHFLGAHSDGSMYNQPLAEEWEQFKFIHHTAGGGNLTLGTYHKKFLSFNADMTIGCSSNKIQSPERFDLLHNTDGSVSIKAHSANQYLMVTDDGRTELTHIHGGWERFWLGKPLISMSHGSYLSSKYVNIVSKHGTCLGVKAVAPSDICAVQNNIYFGNCDEEAAFWLLEKNSDNSYSLRSHYGTYLKFEDPAPHANDGGRYCQAKHVGGGWEKWWFEWTQDGRVRIKSWHNKYMFSSANGDIHKIADGEWSGHYHRTGFTEFYLHPVAVPASYGLHNGNTNQEAWAVADDDESDGVALRGQSGLFLSWSPLNIPTAPALQNSAARRDSWPILRAGNGATEKWEELENAGRGARVYQVPGHNETLCVASSGLTYFSTDRKEVLNRFQHPPTDFWTK